MERIVLSISSIALVIGINAQTHLTLLSEDVQFKNVPGNTTIFNSIANGYHIVGEIDENGFIVWSDSLYLPLGTEFMHNLGIAYFQNSDEYVSIITNKYVEVGFADSIIIHLVKFSTNIDEIIDSNLDTLFSQQWLNITQYTDTSYLVIGVLPLTSNLGYSTYELTSNLYLDSLSAPDSVAVPFSSSDVFFSDDTLYCLQMPNPFGISLYKFGHSSQNFNFSSESNLNIFSNTNFEGVSKWRENFGSDSILFFYESYFWKKIILDYSLNQINFCETARPSEFDPISGNNIYYSIDNSSGQILYKNGYFYIVAKAALTSGDVYSIFKFDNDLNLICKSKIQGYISYEKSLVSIHDEIYFSLINSNTIEFFRINDNCEFSLGNHNSEMNDLVCFPNPTQDVITIQNDFNSGAKYSIISSNGQTLIEGNSLPTNNTIDISEFKNGIYYLIIISGDNKVYSNKVIKIY